MKKKEEYVILISYPLTVLSPHVKDAYLFFREKIKRVKEGRSHEEIRELKSIEEWMKEKEECNKNLEEEKAIEKDKKLEHIKKVVARVNLVELSIEASGNFLKGSS